MYQRVIKFLSLFLTLVPTVVCGQQHGVAYASAVQSSAAAAQASVASLDSYEEQRQRQASQQPQQLAQAVTTADGKTITLPATFFTVFTALQPMCEPRWKDSKPEVGIDLEIVHKLAALAEIRSNENMNSQAQDAAITALLQQESLTTFAELYRRAQAYQAESLLPVMTDHIPVACANTLLHGNPKEKEAVQQLLLHYGEGGETVATNIFNISADTDRCFLRLLDVDAYIQCYAGRSRIEKISYSPDNQWMVLRTARGGAVLRRVDDPEVDVIPGNKIDGKPIGDISFILPQPIDSTRVVEAINGALRGPVQDPDFFKNRTPQLIQFRLADGTRVVRYASSPERDIFPGNKIDGKRIVNSRVSYPEGKLQVTCALNNGVQYIFTPVPVNAQNRHSVPVPEGDKIIARELLDDGTWTISYTSPGTPPLFLGNSCHGADIKSITPGPNNQFVIFELEYRDRAIGIRFLAFASVKDLKLLAKVQKSPLAVIVTAICRELVKSPEGKQLLFDNWPASFDEFAVIEQLHEDGFSPERKVYTKQLLGNELAHQQPEHIEQPRINGNVDVQQSRFAKLFTTFTIAKQSVTQWISNHRAAATIGCLAIAAASYRMYRGLPIVPTPMTALVQRVVRPLQPYVASAITWLQRWRVRPA